MPLYKKAELARELGIHPHTLLNYEKKGLIPAPFRDLNGWRRYTDRHRAELVRLLTEGKKFFKKVENG